MNETARFIVYSYSKSNLWMAWATDEQDKARDEAIRRTAEHGGQYVVVDALLDRIIYVATEARSVNIVGVN